jgi:AcrR family transcriptional regulator
MTRTDASVRFCSIGKANNVDEEKTNDKHASILDVSIHVFAAQGFQGTDVQTIADKAGVGKGTVYRYFGDKESLFWEAWLEVCRRINVCLTNAMSQVDSCVAKLRAATLAEGTFFEENPHCLEMFIQDRAVFRGSYPDRIQSHLDESYTQPFIQLFRQAVDNGELRDVDPSDLYWAFVAAVGGTLLNQAYRDSSIPLSERLARTFDLLIDGLKTIPTSTQNREKS